MASIRKEVVVEAEPPKVWDALRDVGSVHARLARGFVVDTRLEGDVRQVTFANGFSVSEQIIAIDGERRRLVYSAKGGRTTHHNASFEVFEESQRRTRLVWVAEFLPESAAAVVEAMMALGVSAQRTLESSD
jgi:carbon monoxide dehydrogenase subunit G